MTMTATLTKLSPQDVQARVNSGRAVLVDIREPDEFARSHVAGAHSQPLSGWEQSHLTIDPDADVVFTCRTGMRTAGACDRLAAGFFGIGGGFLIAPGLMASTGMTLANASASSLVSVTLFGTATSLSYASAGKVVWPLFGALVVGGAAGTLAAMPVSKRLAGRGQLARALFALMVIAVGVWILIR